MTVSQTIAIILRFREEEADQFEKLFENEVYPLWQQFKAQGKFISASLTPAQVTMDKRDGVRDYILHVEAAGMAQHDEFDSFPPFLSFLEKVRPMQPEEPKVWFGDTLFQI
jgi:hypothetical protein